MCHDWLWLGLYNLSLGTFNKVLEVSIISQILIVKFNILSYNFLDVNFRFYFDFFSVCFFFVLVIIIWGILDFSYVYVPFVRKLYFYVFFFGFCLSMVLLIFIPSIFSVLLAWDGLAIFSFLLVIYYGKSVSFSSGFYVYFIQRLGDSFFVIGIGMFFFLNGNFENSGPSSNVSLVVCLFFFLAFITKSAQYPFNSWLPLAMAAPTPVSALVHSSTLVTAGVYMLFRYSYFLIDSLGFLVIICSLLTMIGGRFWACVETDIKKLVAFSTTANLGFMIFSLRIGKFIGSFFHLIFHACFKALLFVRVGHIIYFCHIQDVRSLGGFVYLKISLSWAVVFCVCSIVGLPFFRGFFSKHLVLGLLISKIFNFSILLIIYLYLFLRGFYSWRLISFLFGTNKMLSSFAFKFNVFSSNWKLVFLGIFSYFLLREFRMVSISHFDVFSVIFYFFSFLGSFLGFVYVHLFQLFPVFPWNFYNFLCVIECFSPVGLMWRVQDNFGSLV